MKKEVKMKGIKKNISKLDADYLKCDIWELYSDIFQIHWVNGHAVEVSVYGKIFKATK